MNILAIGNSFSSDAMYYLHGIASAVGEQVEAVNLYIGGCSLEQHYRNMLEDKKAYCLEHNGASTGFFVSIKEALLNRKWDVITLQQASIQSFKAETYFPYIEALARYARELSPAARIFIHQTWAYEREGDLASAGYASHEAMFSDVSRCYAEAKERIRADGMIPSGALFEMLREKKSISVLRDTHASWPHGRYALALLWYRILTGKSVISNPFRAFDTPMDDGACVPALIAEDTVLDLQKCVEACASVY